MSATIKDLIATLKEKEDMKVISVSEKPEFLDIAIKYIQDKWANANTMMVYEDCINHSVHNSASLPRWYLLIDEDKIIGCAGLITNDFISRMDLMPWLCALYIKEDYRGQALGRKLIDRAKWDAIDAGYKNMYLCTDHDGYYEKYGFRHIGTGYHPWGEASKIYSINL